MLTLQWFSLVTHFLPILPHTGQNQFFASLLPFGHDPVSIKFMSERARPSLFERARSRLLQAMSERARSRSRQARQARQSRNYQCAVCKRRMPAGVWQVWELVVVPDDEICVLDPVYPDSDGQIWATRCQRCRFAQAI